MIVNTIVKPMNNVNGVYAPNMAYQNKFVDQANSTDPVGANKVMPKTSPDAERSMLSRYTYAIGSDGKRYVLQLRINISSSSVSLFA